MFEGFLKDRTLYQQCEEFWDQLTVTVVADLDLKESWSTWLNTSFVDGSRFLDGDPICSAIASDQARALRVVQVEDDPDPFVIWFDYFDDRVPVLVLRLVAANRTLALAKLCLSVWLDLRIPWEEASRVLKAGCRDFLG